MLLWLQKFLKVKVQFSAVRKGPGGVDIGAARASRDGEAEDFGGKKR
jgi:hypothetical protein